MAGQGLDLSRMAAAKAAQFQREVVKKVLVIEEQITNLNKLPEKVKGFDDVTAMLNQKVRQFDNVLNSIKQFDTLSKKIEDYDSVFKEVKELKARITKIDAENKSQEKKYKATIKQMSDDVTELKSLIGN